MYKRKINLMEDCMSLENAHDHYAQKKNPHPGRMNNVKKVPQSNEEIIDFVVKEMSPTLGMNA